jgi:hypothetical protein
LIHFLGLNLRYQLRYLEGNPPEPYNIALFDLDLFLHQNYLKGTYIRHEFACQPQVVVNYVEFILPQVLGLVEVVGPLVVDDVHQLVISLEVDNEVLLLVL